MILNINIGFNPSCSFNINTLKRPGRDNILVLILIKYYGSQVKGLPP